MRSRDAAPFEVARVGGIGVAEFRAAYSARNLPVILPGCVDHWPARTRWNLDYFADRFGDKLLHFSDRDWRLADLIGELRRGAQPAPYLNQVKLDEQFPELYEDIADLAFTRDNLLSSRWLPHGMRITRGIKALFIGGAGSGFGKLHWDVSYLHVFISQLNGEKDFVLFAPSDTPYVYPHPERPNDSLIRDFNNLDLDECPLLRRASPIRFTLRAGETVFIPAGWWHATRMHGASISIAESALDKHNWRRRYRDTLAVYRQQNVPALKRALTGAYMAAVEHLVL